MDQKREERVTVVFLTRMFLRKRKKKEKRNREKKWQLLEK